MITDYQIENFRSQLEGFFKSHATILNLSAEFVEGIHVVADIGIKYVRIVREERVGNNRHVRFAYAFLDRATGDILMSASWKAPAKHARGNIAQPNEQLFGDGKVCGPYGVARLR
jgi:hypothetical protein